MSDAAQRVRAAVRDGGVVAVLRLREHSRAVAVGEALLDGGIRVMEVTLDDPGALAAVRALRDALGDRVVLGTGTVLTPDQVRAGRDAGASFCVSPHTDPALIEAVHAAGLLPLPGAMTPTDIAVARRAGAELIKLFPAGPLGPAYLSALQGPFGGVGFVPTGGIRHDGLRPWFAAGAVAVGLGSDLVPARPDDADLAAIADRARTVCAQVADAR